jgi:hypothetical protein
MRSVSGLRALSVGHGEEIRGDLGGKLAMMLCKELLAKLHTRFRARLVRLFTDHLQETIVHVCYSLLVLR